MLKLGITRVNLFQEVGEVTTVEITANVRSDAYAGTLVESRKINKALETLGNLDFDKDSEFEENLRAWNFGPTYRETYDALDVTLSDTQAFVETTHEAVYTAIHKVMELRTADFDFMALNHWLTATLGNFKLIEAKGEGDGE